MSPATTSAASRKPGEQLTGLFLLVVAGEFNSGKSSFINALLGERVLPEGVTPTTDRINVLRHGPEVSEQLREAYLLERTHPADVLREINIVDTPGTNAIIRRHEELTRDFVPRSDLVLFVTSADRPFTESERAFLEQIREWGKKIVFIVNKIDILTRPEERDEVVRYVREHATALLGETPQIFAVSARQALEARSTGKAGTDGQALWETSGFGAVEDYLLNTLDQEERVRLKLLNPLNVGLRLASKYKDATFERLKLLAQDVEAIQNIDQQLGAVPPGDAAGLRAPAGPARRSAGRHGAAGHAFLRGDHPDRSDQEPHGQRGGASEPSSGRSSARRPGRWRTRWAG